MEWQQWFLTAEALVSWVLGYHYMMNGRVSTWPTSILWALEDAAVFAVILSTGSESWQYMLLGILALFGVVANIYRAATHHVTRASDPNDGPLTAALAVVFCIVHLVLIITGA